MSIRAKLSCALLLLAGVAGQAIAGPIVVDARLNSSTGGSGANAGTVSAGDTIVITVATTDLWSAGALPRWSNANGLTGPLLATGSDESGQAAGVQIGANFGQHSQGGLSTAFGTLVGRIGGGSFFVVGTNFSGVAGSSGVLSLYYWDSNSEDNTNFVTANVTIRPPNSVPEPSSLMLLAIGLLAAAYFARTARRA